MTIDETIKYYLDIADGQDKCAEISVSEYAKESMRESAADHRQLAEWLTELKNRREVSEIEKRAIEKCDKCLDIFDCPLYYPWLKE